MQVCYSWWCLSALSILGRLHWIDQDELTRFILFCQVRDCSNIAFALHSDKLQDIVFTLAKYHSCPVIIYLQECCSIEPLVHGLAHNLDMLVFIMHVQDEHDGGISDRPEDMVDAFHTFFGLAALSLMGYEGLEPIDPVYALPVKVMKRLRQQQHK